MSEPSDPSADTRSSASSDSRGAGASPSGAPGERADAPPGASEVAITANLQALGELVEALGSAIQGAEADAHRPGQRRLALALPASWVGLFVLANLFAGHASPDQVFAVAALASPWMLVVAALLCAGALAPLALVPPGPATRRWLLASLLSAPAAGLFALLPLWGRSDDDHGLLPLRLLVVVVVMALVAAQSFAYLALHRRMLALPRGTFAVEAARAAFLAVLVGLAGGALLALAVHALPVAPLKVSIVEDLLPLTVDPRLAAFVTGMVASWCLLLAVRARRTRTDG